MAGVSGDAVSGSVVNFASVLGAELDPSASNDSDSAAVLVSGGGLPLTGVPLDFFAAVGVAALVLGSVMILATRKPH